MLVYTNSQAQQHQQQQAQAHGVDATAQQQQHQAQGTDSKAGQSQAEQQAAVAARSLAAARVPLSEDNMEIDSQNYLNEPLSNNIIGYIHRLFHHIDHSFTVCLIYLHMIGNTISFIYMYAYQKPVY